MPSAYFQAILCPGWDDGGAGQASLSSSPLYRASHHVLTTDAVWGLMAVAAALVGTAYGGDASRLSSGAEDDAGASR
jgi:hypothetical protein